MYNDIVELQKENSKIVMTTYRLHDVHIDFDIYGIKIYDYRIFCNYPYDLKSISCEVEQLDRMKADGYIYYTREPVVGDHSPLWSEPLIFERYFNLMEKFKEYKYAWLETVPFKLWQKFQRDPSDLNLYALLGACWSIMQKDLIMLGEKDYTKYESDEYKRIRDIFNIELGNYTLADKPEWTEEYVFNKYLKMLEMGKDVKIENLSKIPKFLIEKLKVERTNKALYSLLGAFASIIHKEKVKILNRSPEMGRIKSYLQFPSQSTLYMTGRCNLKCSFCRRQQIDMTQTGDMTLQVAKDIVTKFPFIQGYCLCGFGEVLLVKELIPIMKYLKKNGKYIGLITNGVLLSQRLLEIMHCIPQYINISVNAYDRESHENMSSTKTWDKVISGIKDCVKNKIETHLSFVVSHYNWDKVPFYLKLTKELRAKAVLHNLLPHDFDTNKEFLKDALTYDDIPMINKMKKDINADICIRWPILIGEKIERNCQSPWNMLGFDASGNISTCMSIEEPNSKNGNMYEHVVWHNDYANRMRESITGEQLNMCKHCFRNYEKPGNDGLTEYNI